MGVNMRREDAREFRGNPDCRRLAQQMDGGMTAEPSFTAFMPARVLARSRLITTVYIDVLY